MARALHGRAEEAYAHADDKQHRAIGFAIQWGSGYATQQPECPAPPHIVNEREELVTNLNAIKETAQEKSLAAAQAAEAEELRAELHAALSSGAASWAAAATASVEASSSSAPLMPESSPDDL